MTERKMTAKGFVHKASAAKSAQAFLAAHREWLSTGPHATAVVPMLEAVDRGEAMPTPTLREISNVVMAFAIAETLHKSSQPASGGGRPRKEYPFTAKLLDDAGNVSQEKSFDDYNSARKWCDRRLVVDSGPRWSGSVIDNRSARVSPVDRDAALAAAFGGRKMGPVCKTPAKSAPLKSKMKVSNYKARFSAG